MVPPLLGELTRANSALEIELVVGDEETNLLRRRADVAALVKTSLALAQLLQERPDIDEIGINPLMLRAEGCGAVAVDALIRVEDET